MLLFVKSAFVCTLSQYISENSDCQEIFRANYESGIKKLSHAATNSFVQGMGKLFYDVATATTEM